MPGIMRSVRHDVDAALAHDLERVLAVLGREHRQPLAREDALERLEVRGFVIDHQQRQAHRSWSASLCAKRASGRDSSNFSYLRD